MPVYEVVTAEMFTVVRQVVANSPREAAQKAVQGDPKGQAPIIRQEGDGYVEGSRVIVYKADGEEPVGEFDAWVVASGDEEEEAP